MLEMQRQRLLPVGRHPTCREIARDSHPHQRALQKRLTAAPAGVFLAVELLTVRHEGEKIEGVGRYDSSADRGMFWGATFTSSALVAIGENPYLLRCAPFPERRMATPAYPKLGRYVKRLRVAMPEVGEVRLLVVWKWQRSEWYLAVLVSTLAGGVQSVMRA